MYLTESNCLKETGHELNFFIELTGIFGIHAQYNIIDYGVFKATLFNNRVNIFITTNVLLKFVRSIDLVDGEISNDYLVKDKKSTEGKVGFRILKSQVDFANKVNFKVLIVDAHRDPNNPFWDGYWLWGKYGYFMDEPPFRTKFLNEMRPNFSKLNISNQNIPLHEFLAIDEGMKIWKQDGRRWDGHFDLSDGSESLKILNNR